jgi:hypothetical protein
MKKRDKKMQLNRETVLRLDELAKAQGGNDTVAPLQDTGRYSSCGQPNCGCDTWVDTV